MIKILINKTNVFQFVLFYGVVTNLKSQSVKTGFPDPGGKLDSLQQPHSEFYTL